MLIEIKRVKQIVRAGRQGRGKKEVITDFS